MRAPIEAAAMCVRRYAAVLLTALALSLNADASAQEGKPAEKLFAGEPTVAAVKEGCKISFKMARPTDVTVRILDKDGKVVRHLASGMVGLEKAVALFKPNSLEQEIVWDRKDDRGADAGAGPFSVELGEVRQVPARRARVILERDHRVRRVEQDRPCLCGHARHNDRTRDVYQGV